MRSEAIARALQQAWQTRGAMARALWPVAQLYGALVAGRRLLYALGIFKSTRLPVPVVVVGNVVAGGGGKTPLVIALVRHLQAQGLRCGVVSRGYGRTSPTCQEVLPGMRAAEAGDEPLLIRRATGAAVVVGAQRVDAARLLLAAHPETDLIVCDDGLQHYPLQRDINIAVFDARGVGNGWLLPAGPLREKLPALRLADGSGTRVRGIDLRLRTGGSALASLFGFGSTRRLADEAVAADGTRVGLDSLQGQPLVAVAGIANPQAFFDMLIQRGLTLQTTLARPDHHRFDDASALQTALFSSGLTALCTEKDAVKLFAAYPDAGQRLLAVPLEFVPAPAFFEAFDAMLAGIRSPIRSPLPSDHGHTPS